MALCTAVNPKVFWQTGKPAAIATESAPQWGRETTRSMCLEEKSVSPSRTLDNQCCAHHTVVYLIRYAIL